MLTAVSVGCIWGCIYFSHYLTHNLLAIVCHCCSLRKPQKVLKMSRSKKLNLFLWPSSAFLPLCFFINVKAYNRICWLESELYLSIDMRDLFWRWWAVERHFIHMIPPADTEANVSQWVLLLSILATF